MKLIGQGSMTISQLYFHPTPETVKWAFLTIAGRDRESEEWGGLAPVEGTEKDAV